MSQLTKTVIFCSVAVVCALAAVFFVPSQKAPAVFQDQGSAFFPKSFSPLQIGSIEVTSWNEEHGQPKPFKVEYKGGRWVIPSAENYAADVKDRLARMTALMTDLKRGELRSEREADFDKYGVIDPRKEDSSSTKGRGRRVTIKDMSGGTLADLIIGDQVEKRFGYYYVRQPDSKRVYTCKIDASAISTRFADWVETDLLKITSSSVRKFTFDNYQVRIDDDGTSLVPGQIVEASKDSAGAWSLQGGVPAGSELDKEKLDTAASTLSQLTLVGVRHKPAGLLEAIARYEKGQFASRQEQAMFVRDLNRRLIDLTRIGYFPAPGSNNTLRILSKEGEIRVACDDGVVYTLRMGDIVVGEADELAGAAASQPARATTAPAGGREHRYLFVTVDFDESLLGERPKMAASKPATAATTQTATTGPATRSAAEIEFEQKTKDFDKKVADGKKRRDDLAKKFDEWYYIVAADAYAKLKLNREALVKKPTTQPTMGPMFPMPSTQPTTAKTAAKTLPSTMP